MMVKLYAYGVFAFFLLLALALLLTITPAAQSPASPFIPEAVGRPVTIAAVGDPLPRIQCPTGYTATVYAEGLSSPDGLAFGPGGLLYVAEETAGRVSRVEAGGLVTPVLSGLVNPEGIAFDDVGNLYVVEDVQAGRVVKMATSGVTATLAVDRDAPEGVVCRTDGAVFITESNAQFAANPPVDIVTHVTAISSLGDVTRVLSDVVVFSYAGITLGSDGLLYVSNELSGPGNDRSIFKVDPLLGTSTLFARGLVIPEGLRFAAEGQFPLYVVEEDTGGGAGRLSRVEADGSHAPFCTGFFNIEDVALDEDGRLYVSEDSSGSVILIQPLYDVAMEKVAEPPDGATVGPGERITYTLVLTNDGAADTIGLVLTDALPADVSYVPGSVSAPPELSLLATPPPALVFTGTLPARKVLTVTFLVSVSMVPSGTLLVNAAEVTAVGSTVVTDVTTHAVAVAAPSLSITKTVTPASGSYVAPGAPITYTVTVINGGGPASDVVLSDTLDLAHVTLVVSHTTSGLLSGPNPVRLTGFDLQSGQGVTLTLGVTVTGDVSGTIVINQASLTSTQTPFPQLSNVVTHVISNTVVMPPDLALLKSADPPGGTPLTQGDTVTYTVVVRNSGGLATNVLLTDPIPAGTAYLQGSAIADPYDADFDETQVTVSVPTFPVGLALTLTFRVTVTTGVTATITNTALLSSDQTALAPSNLVSHPVRGVRRYYLYLPLLLKLAAGP